MSIEIVSAGSSSSGNSYIITAGGTNLILDVGLTAKRIIEALASSEIAPEDVSAVLITHEHTDHVKSVRAIGRKCCNAVFVASRGTVDKTPNFCYIDVERLRIVAAGDTLGNDEVKVSVFALSHDAKEPVGYMIESGGEKLAVVTDTGIVTPEIYEMIADADLLVLESNHDEELLMFGEYPYPLKVRIKGDHGHLSNRCAGETLARILTERAAAGTPDVAQDGSEAESAAGTPTGTQDGARKKKKPLRVMLAHLSSHNNAPFYARHTVEDILKEEGFERDVDYELTIAAKDELTFLSSAGL